MVQEKRRADVKNFIIPPGKEIGEDEVVCRRHQCELLDVDCMLNKTHTISWHFLGFPTVEYLPNAVTLLSMEPVLLRPRDDRSRQAPRFRVRILSGNELGLFAVNSNGNKGELQVVRPVYGPVDHKLKILMSHLNPANTVLSNHLALVTVYVSKYDF